MSKRTLMTLFMMISVVLLIFLLCSCGNNSDEHTHMFASEWTHDSTHHWHACTEGNCKDTEAKAQHNYTVYKSEGPNSHSVLCECTASISEVHNWSVGEVTVQPTESTKGERTYTCLGCGATYKEEIAPIVNNGQLGGESSPNEDNEEPQEHRHSFLPDWEYDDTYHYHKCDTGGCTEISDIEEHIWDIGVVTVQPSPNNSGLRLFTCTICGHTRTEQVIYTVSTIVTEAEWENIQHITNCTIIMVSDMSYGTETTEIKKCADRISRNMDGFTTYMACCSGVWYDIHALPGGNFAVEVDYDGSISDITGLNIGEYAEYQYSDEQKAYVKQGHSMIFIEDGRIVRAIFYTANGNFTLYLSNYGTTVIDDFPDFEFLITEE